MPLDREPAATASGKLIDDDVSDAVNETVSGVRAIEGKSISDDLSDQVAIAESLPDIVLLSLSVLFEFNFEPEIVIEGKIKAPDTVRNVVEAEEYRPLPSIDLTTTVKE